jgi:hypothetical protein
MECHRLCPNAWLESLQLSDPLGETLLGSPSVSNASNNRACLQLPGGSGFSSGRSNRPLREFERKGY